MPSHHPTLPPNTTINTDGTLMQKHAPKMLKRWGSPRDHEHNRKSFFEDKIAKAEAMGSMFVVPHRETHEVSHVGRSSARVHHFGDTAFNLVVTGLRGCVSVVIASKKGCYMSHFWEGHSICQPSEEVFRTDIIDGMFTGDGEIFPALNPLLAPGGIFDRSDPALRVQITVFAPLAMPESWENAQKGVYPPRIDVNTADKIEQIRQTLKNTWTNVKVTVTGYRTFRGGGGQMIWSDELNDAVRGWEWAEALSLLESSYFGRILLQYHPKVRSSNDRDGPSDVAGYRVWYDNSRPALKGFWKRATADPS